MFIQHNIPLIANINIMNIQQLLQRILCNKIDLYGGQASLAYTYSCSQNDFLLDQPFQQLIICKLTINHNAANNNPICVNQAFPDMKIQFKDDNYGYIFPQEPIRCSNKVGKYTANYGGRMHFPFIAVQQQRKALMIATGGEDGEFREISMQKTEKGGFKFKNLYYNIDLKAGQYYELPKLYFVSYTIRNDFLTTTVNVYKQLSKFWVRAQNKSNFLIKSQFNSNFIMRVIELYEIEWHQSQKRVKDLSNLKIMDLIKQDEDKIGKIGFVHFRDWSAKGKDIHSKFGNYFHKEFVGTLISKQWLKDEIKTLKSNGIQIGFYIEGYLVSQSLLTQIEKLSFEQLQMLDKDGKPYTTWGSSNYVICPACKNWKKILADAIYNIFSYFDVKNFYIDEYGFGFKTSPYKVCTNKNHIHINQFDLQVSEHQVLQTIYDKLQDQQINLYIEQTPSHTIMNSIEGSLSTAARLAVQNTDQIPILLSRFIRPDHKVYQILTQYTMASEETLKNNKKFQQDIFALIRGICIALWNGNGIYVPKNLDFYDKKVIQTIKQCNHCYQTYSEYFNDLDPISLKIGQIQKGINQILGNQFHHPFKNSSIIILLNLSQIVQSTKIYSTLKKKKIQISLNPKTLAVFMNGVGQLESIIKFGDI